MRTSVALCLALVVCSCGRPAGPDIVLVTLDTTRADRLGAMGRTEAHTRSSTDWRRAACSTRAPSPARR